MKPNFPMTTHPFSSRSFVRRLAAAALPLALLAMTACTRTPTISTLAAGHAITADIDGNSTKVEALPERGVLSSEFGQVTIERARMRVGELAWVKIAEDVPVNVTIHRGKIALNAGRVSVAQTVSHP